MGIALTVIGVVLVMGFILWGMLYLSPYEKHLEDLEQAEWLDNHYSKKVKMKKANAQKEK